MEEAMIKEVHNYFPEIRKWRSTKKLEKAPFFKNLKPILSQVLDQCETGDFLAPLPQAKPAYKAVSWNAERGMVFDGLVNILKTHPEISKADLYFVPETDVGMARSQNRNVARELARALGMSYAFAPCYLNLDKGNGIEVLVEGENELGLHGNAILSGWPLKNPRAIRLKNCKDKLRGREKRLGSQQAIVADMFLPEGPVRVVCLHLDAHSSQRQRYFQTKTILDALERENWKGPTLIGGDWNTSTYCASHAFFAFFSFWRKVAMGPKYVCETHYPYPDRYFEKSLFKMLEARGFDYKNFNALGVPTIHYQLGDEQKNKNLRDWTPKFFQIFVDWAMKKVEGLASFKLDWFVGQNLKPIAGSQKVIKNLVYQNIPVSDHDAIMVDFR